MSARLFTVLLVFIVVISGCGLQKKTVPQTLSNVSVRTSFSPSAQFPAGSKYAFVTFAADSDRSEDAEPDLIDQRIVNALAGELKKKGYKPGSYSDIRFFVAYTLQLEQQFDLLIGKSKIRGNEWIAGLVVPNNYVSGAFLVQIIDAESMEPVWLGIFDADIEIASLSEKEKQHRVEFAVQQLLKSFPPR